MLRSQSQSAYARVLLAVDPKTYRDSREVPRYTIAEVACYLDIKSSTLRSWVLGRTYAVTSGERVFWEPLITPALRHPKNPSLSYFNLAEAHVLAATRFKFGIRMPNIRSALDELQKVYPSDHPLITKGFHTDGVDLFVKSLENWVNMSRRGQLGLKDVLDLYLKRIEWDIQGLPIKIWPLKGQVDHLISILPGVGRGRPIIDRKGVRVAIIWKRAMAGEDEAALADDYGLTVSETKAAISYFSDLKAA